MFGLESIELLAIIAVVFAIVSFFGNMYLCCKVHFLRQKIDSVERIGKLAKLECPKLEAAAGSKEEQAQAGIVSDLISSILDAAAAPEKLGQKQSKKTSSFSSTPMGGRGSPF